MKQFWTNYVAMGVTDKLRHNMRYVLIGTIVAGVVGWFLGRDPSQLAPVIAWETAALAVGEGSNIGKRATFDKDAVGDK